MPHGVDLLPCLERVRSAQNTEESTSCTLSITIEPDSRGLDRGIQYAGASRLNHNRLWNTGSPGQAGRWQL